MSDLNFGDCIGCGLCILGCPAYEETGFDVLTARGRNKALQAGLAAPAIVESIWACTLCGYCDAICPSGVDTCTRRKPPSGSIMRRTCRRTAW